MIPSDALRFTLHGDDPEATVALKQILEEELGAEVIESRPQADRDTRTKSPDPIAVAALIFSVPATILAFDQLADRLTRKKQMDQTLERVKRKVETSRVKVTVTYPDGRTKTIEKVTTTEILDQLDRSHA